MVVVSISKFSSDLNPRTNRIDRTLPPFHATSIGNFFLFHLPSGNVQMVLYRVNCKFRGTGPRSSGIRNAFRFSSEDIGGTGRCRWYWRSFSSVRSCLFSRHPCECRCAGCGVPFAATGSAVRYNTSARMFAVLVRLISRFSWPRSGPIASRKT